MTNSIQSTILNMTTCKQVQDMMDMLEQLQSLCISHYEGIAMQEQQEITKLESIISTTTETYAPRLGEIAQRAVTPDLILEARDLYARAKASLKDAYVNPAKCSMGGFEESEAELYLIIEELRAAGHTAACEHCEALQSLMTSVYEGLLISGRV